MCLQRRSKLVPKGFSLIEVLIAMLLLCMGSAGLALLLMASVQGTAEAQTRSQLATHASELAQLIQANPATLGHFIFPIPNPQMCGDALPCSSADWAAGHLQNWQQELERSLEQSKGVVCRDATPWDGGLSDMACDGKGQPLVKIVWQEGAPTEQGPELQTLVMPISDP